MYVKYKFKLFEKNAWDELSKKFGCPGKELLIIILQEGGFLLITTSIKNTSRYL